jgi:predicted metalloprotease
MEWEDARRSDNIEDRRGDSSVADGGGGLGLPGTGGLGIGVIIVLAIIGYFTGIDPRVLIGGAQVVTQHQASQYSPDQSRSAPAPSARTGAPKDQMGDFVAAVLGEIEDVWTEQLPAQTGTAYTKPRLVLYSTLTRSDCGRAESAMGPFYCPTDQRIYLDMSFFNDMRTKLGGGGDFAYAYVIAHEVGHHVQNLLGTLPKVHAAQEQADQQAANALSVRLELQADCFAGVWAANADKKWHILDAGDADKALATARAIGDDRLQKATGGSVVPDSFTHGTSEQRQQWLKTGLSTGKVAACNTFAR